MAFLNEPIALVGLACRFPGAPDARSLWSLLTQRGESIGPPTVERLSALQTHNSAPATPPPSGFLDHTERFDFSFFGLTRAEAARMDPRQRLALELAWEALEDGDRLSHTVSATGVYLGVMGRAPRCDTHAGGLAQDILADEPSSIAGSIASFFDLSGPAMAVETATSSSLVAIHLACQALWSGEVEVALAGGLNVFRSCDEWAALQALGTLSPEPHIRPFDAEAAGYVRGEGGGLVVLKRLSRAVEDGNRIYCKVLSSAVNHNGKNRAMVAPKAAAQSDLLKRAYGRHDAPGDLIYIEAHGSGTRSGDEAEWSAIAEFAARRSAPLAIGSVKPNVGHLEPAAGVAGLIKVALCAAFGRIPPTLNSSNPRFQSQFVQVQSETTEWPLETIAGVTSLGMTGSNCHIVVGRPPCSAKLLEGVPPPPYLFLMSARTTSTLKRLALSTAQWCADWQDSDLYSICYTAAHGRPLLEVRAALEVSSIEDLRFKLLAFGDGRVDHRGSDYLYSASGALFPVRGNLVTLPPYPWERQPLKTELMNNTGEQVRSMASQILEIPKEALDQNVRLIELGLDSLRALELENRLMGDLGVEIPASELLSSITLLELTAIVEPRAAVCL